MPRPARQSPLQLISGLLRNNIRTLSGLVLVAVVASSVPLGMRWLADPYRFPLGVVEVRGDFRFMEKEQLQVAVAPHAAGGFFTVDVNAVRAAAEQLPWVHKVSVRRIWPATLRLQVEEQQPIAHWGERGYLNRFGEPFLPEETAMPLELPWLAGPDGHEIKVLEYYLKVTQALGPLGMQVARLELDGRRAWHLQLHDGVRLELGRANTWQRLQRFVRAYPEVFVGREAQLQRVDLRYSNGFSVHWQQAEADSAAGLKGQQG